MRRITTLEDSQARESEALINSIKISFLPAETGFAAARITIIADRAYEYHLTRQADDKKDPWVLTPGTETQKPLIDSFGDLDHAAEVLMMNIQMGLCNPKNAATMINFKQVTGKHWHYDLYNDPTAKTGVFVSSIDRDKHNEYTPEYCAEHIDKWGVGYVLAVSRHSFNDVIRSARSFVLAHQRRQKNKTAAVRRAPER